MGLWCVGGARRDVHVYLFGQMLACECKGLDSVAQRPLPVYVLTSQCSLKQGFFQCVISLKILEFFTCLRSGEEHFLEPQIFSYILQLSSNNYHINVQRFFIRKQHLPNIITHVLQGIQILNSNPYPQELENTVISQEQMETRDNNQCSSIKLHL